MSVLSKQSRFRVMRLSEEEEFFLDVLAGKVVMSIKEDPDFRVVFEAARLIKEEKGDEIIDDID